jgi:hypothetical protein
MSQLYKVLCVTVFLLGIGGFTTAFLRQDKNPTEVEPAQPFVVTYTLVQLDSTGTVTRSQWRIRYVKANGEWQQITHKDPASKAKADTSIMAGLEDGVYAVPSGTTERKFLSPAADKQMLTRYRTHQFLKNHKEFVRMDKVAGLDVYVLRTEVNNPASTLEWIEECYSPKAAYTPLRTTQHYRDGSESRVEAIKVEFREVPDNLNDDLKAMPVTKSLEHH